MTADVKNSMAGKNYPSAIENAIEKILTRVAISIEGDAVARVPVDTGRLKGSITYATQKERSYAQKSGDEVSRPFDKMTAHVGSNVEYAQHIEYRTRHMRPQPFLRPALDANRVKSQRITQQEIREALKRGR